LNFLTIGGLGDGCIRLIIAPAKPAWNPPRLEAPHPRGTKVADSERESVGATLGRDVRMRDVWKSALEWFIYYRDLNKKAKYAEVIMRVKDRLSAVTDKGDLVQHYMAQEGLCEEVLSEIYPHEEWLDIRRVEDAAYGLRCLELSTAKQFDLRRRIPSRWLLETAA